MTRIVRSSPQRWSFGGARVYLREEDSKSPVGGEVPGHFLNLRGEVCPLTFVRVRLWLEQAPIGASASVEVDYEPATRSIERSLRILGQEFCGCEALPDGAWRLQLRKIVADPTEIIDATAEREADG